MKVKKLYEDALLPKRATDKSAGYDLYSYQKEDAVIKKGETFKVHTGICLSLPHNTAGLIYARSGLAVKSGIAPANCVGVIDEDYRGEIIVALYNHSDKDFILRDKERIAQMVITPCIYEEICEVDELSETERGEGRFGSTGMK